jgi:hypothetical protein
LTNELPLCIYKMKIIDSDRLFREEPFWLITKIIPIYNKEIY